MLDVTENATQPEGDEGASPVRRVPSGLIAVLSLAAAGTLALRFADAIANTVVSAAPHSFRARSGGTFFPTMEVALPPTVRGLGVVMLIGAGVAALSPVFRSAGAARTVRWARVVALVALVGGTFGFYAWLAYPHNAAPSNSTAHWVDIFFSRKRDFFYTLVKIPHWLFYDYPHILQGLLGALNCLLLWAIGMRAIGRWVPSLLMALSYSISGLMLVFANSAEDVQLNVTALLFVVLAFLLRRRFMVGVALFVATLGRPQFVVLAAAFVAAQVLVAEPDDDGVRLSMPARARAVLADRFLWSNLLTFVVLFFGWQGILAGGGVNWMFANGRLFSSVLLELGPSPVDGYTITQFGGAFAGHLLWIYPAPLLLANGVAAMRWRRLTVPQRRAFVMIWLFVVASVGISEVFPLRWYNVRYLSYAWPMVLVAGWLAFAPSPAARTRAARAGFAVVLALSSATIAHDAFEVRRATLENPLGAAFADRALIRARAGGQPVVTTFRRLRDVNTISYLIKRPRGDVVKIEPGTPTPGAIVFTSSRDGYETAEVLYERPGLVIARTPPE